MTLSTETARVRRERPDALRCEVDEGQACWRVDPAPEGGWAVTGPSPGPALRLERRPGGIGFRLLDGGPGPHPVSYGVEVGGQSADLRYFLLPDGRLYRLVPRGPREAGCELRGWETPGAYLSARPESGGWRLETTAAGTRLPDLSTLRLLLAVELVDADEPLRESVIASARGTIES